MKIFTILLVFCTVVNFSYAQSKKEISAAGVKKITETETRYENGKEIKMIISVNTYDGKGNQTETKEYDKKTGALKNHERFTYDANGNNIKIIEFDTKGKEIKQTLYQYNDDGMKTMKVIFTPPGQIKSKRTYTYEK